MELRLNNGIKKWGRTGEQEEDPFIDLTKEENKHKQELLSAFESKIIKINIIKIRLMMIMRYHRHTFKITASFHNKIRIRIRKNQNKKGD